MYMADDSSSTSETEGPGEQYICDYERERLKNIKENQEMLKMLGKGGW